MRDLGRCGGAESIRSWSDAKSAGRPSDRQYFVIEDTWPVSRHDVRAHGRKVAGPMGVLSITAWLPRYKRSHLRFDVIAGVTVAALVVPKALGYAGIALIPIQNGLYAAAAGALLYALFGTSRRSRPAPVPRSQPWPVRGGDRGSSPQDAPALVAAVTLVAGLMFVVLAALKMGWISRFLSKAVITGFLFGAAIEVVVGELPKLAGTDGSGKNAWREFSHFVSTFNERTLRDHGRRRGLVGGNSHGAVRVAEAPGALVWWLAG